MQKEVVLSVREIIGSRTKHRSRRDSLGDYGQGFNNYSKALVEGIKLVFCVDTLLHSR